MRQFTIAERLIAATALPLATVAGVPYIASALAPFIRNEHVGLAQLAVSFAALAVSMTALLVVGRSIARRVAQASETIDALAYGEIASAEPRPRPRRTRRPQRRHRPPGRRAQRTPAPRSGARRSRSHLAGLASRQSVQPGAAGGSGDRDRRQADSDGASALQSQSRRHARSARSGATGVRGNRARGRRLARDGYRPPANCPIR